MDTLTQMTVPELRELAQQRGLKGLARLRKAELIQLLQTRKGTPRRTPRGTEFDDAHGLPKCEIREQLRDLGQPVSGTKVEMVDRLAGAGGIKRATPRRYRQELDQMTKCQIREELRSRGAKITGIKEEISRRLSYIRAGREEPRLVATPGRFTVRELKAFAKEKGIPGYYDMTKAQLQQALGRR